MRRDTDGWFGNAEPAAVAIAAAMDLRVWRRFIL